MDIEDYQTKAKVLSAEVLRQNHVGLISDWIYEDLYVCWFSKTLQNWKVLVSTDRVNGVYVEVTHNGAKGETYIDRYQKISNASISDDKYSEIFRKHNV